MNVPRSIDLNQEKQIMTTKPAIPDAESMMNRHVHCVTPEMSLAEVVQVFLKHGVSCAPVVDRDGV
ncbi:MAG: CBS domain-containing protein, partial [Planctomycetaceae bacterium]|nr:CBS domain-containing protein [Planctomycetaceae bacterium]